MKPVDNQEIEQLLFQVLSDSNLHFSTPLESLEDKYRFWKSACFQLIYNEQLRKTMAEVIKDYAVVSLSETEVGALIDLFDSLDDLPASLKDLNNNLQTL